MSTTGWVIQYNITQSNNHNNETVRAVYCCIDAAVDYKKLTPDIVTKTGHFVLRSIKGVRVIVSEDIYMV